MKTLAIDTSLAAGSVAALDGDRGDERPLPHAEGHARQLAPALADLARGLGWTPAAVELVVVVRGPGSFTGLRVGVTAAKAIAWSAGAGLVGVSGFAVVARRSARVASGAGTIHVAFDAGRGEVFTADATADRATPGGWRIGPARLLAGAAWLAALPPAAYVSGPALAAAADPTMADLLHGRRRDVVVCPPDACLPTAREAADLGRELARAGLLDDPHSLVPEYLRPTYADEAAARRAHPAPPAP